MAKKGHRDIFALRCEVCKNNNYITEKNKLNDKEKLSFKKFCKHCKKVTLHRESDKLD